MSQDEEKKVQKTGASPLRAVRIFCTFFDEVADHVSLAAVGIHFATRSK
jgi:hypothetical protein